MKLADTIDTELSLRAAVPEYCEKQTFAALTDAFTAWREDPERPLQEIAVDLNARWLETPLGASDATHAQWLISRMSEIVEGPARTIAEMRETVGLSYQDVLNVYTHIGKYMLDVDAPGLNLAPFASDANFATLSRAQGPEQARAARGGSSPQHPALHLEFADTSDVLRERLDRWIAQVPGRLTVEIHGGQRVSQREVQVAADELLAVRRSANGPAEITIDAPAAVVHRFNQQILLEATRGRRSLAIPGRELDRRERELLPFNPKMHEKNARDLRWAVDGPVVTQSAQAAAESIVGQPNVFGLR